MSPIRRNGIFYLYLPRQSGGSVLRTTETRDAKVYRGMKRMLADLKDGRRHWALLGAVDTGPLTLGQLYDAYTLNAHDALQATLSASALLPLMNQYVAACVSRGLAPRNVENIKRQLRAFFIYAPTQTTADLSTAIVTTWLASLKTTPGTRRQYLYALTGFTRYLVDVEVLADYPLSRVKAPKKNAARMTYMDAATDERIVQAARSDVRPLFAFVKATGCDLTTALNITRRDIDLARGTARLKGTKTAHRDGASVLGGPLGGQRLGGEASGRSSISAPRWRRRSRMCSPGPASTAPSRPTSTRPRARSPT